MQPTYSKPQPTRVCGAAPPKVTAEAAPAAVRHSPILVWQTAVQLIPKRGPAATVLARVVRRRGARENFMVGIIDLVGSLMFVLESGICRQPFYIKKSNVSST
jgi:hypothetical protein